MLSAELLLAPSSLLDCFHEVENRSVEIINPNRITLGAFVVKGRR